MAEMTRYNFDKDEFVAHLQLIDSVLKDGVPNDFNMQQFRDGTLNSPSVSYSDLENTIIALRESTIDVIERISAESFEWGMIESYYREVARIIENPEIKPCVEAGLREYNDIEDEEYRKISNFGLQ